MAKMVGMSRNLKLAWLNQTAVLAAKGLPDEDIKAQLDEYLRYEIESPTNRRKTISILMYIWIYENEHTRLLRAKATSLIQCHPEYSLEIHWCMMLSAYPMFRDVCSLIGKMAEFQDEIALHPLRQKLFDEWGERTTLEHSLAKLIATLKEFDVLTSEAPGKYHIKYHEVRDTEISQFMLYCAINADRSRTYTFSESSTLSVFFPFEYRIVKENLFQDKRFSIENSGKDIKVSLIS